MLFIVNKHACQNYCFFWGRGGGDRNFCDYVPFNYLRNLVLVNHLAISNYVFPLFECKEYEAKSEMKKKTARDASFK